MDWEAEGKECQAEIITTTPGKYRWSSLAYFCLPVFFFFLFNLQWIYVKFGNEKKPKDFTYKIIQDSVFNPALADFTLASKKLNSSNHRQQREQKPGAHGFAQDPHSTRLRASAALPPSCISFAPTFLTVKLTRGTRDKYGVSGPSPRHCDSISLGSPSFNKDLYVITVITEMWQTVCIKLQIFLLT